VSGESSGREVFRFGTFELDARAGELRKQGARIKLQEQPLRILEMLLAQPGQLVTREELRSRLWPSDSFVDFDHGLNKAINKLREALDDSAESPRFVETVPRRGYRMISPLGKAQGRIESLVVLPLEDLAHDPAQEYFADGLTEALITSLAKIGALRVISRTTAMRYKQTDKSVPQIAQELNVDAVVEGTVQRSGERVRISAQLIQASTDTHMWAESYERDLRDILALESEVARAIATEVQAKLTPREEAQLARTRPVNPDAYEAYLIARHYWSQRSGEALKKAAEYFRQAVEKDPTYAPAHAGLADMCASAGVWGLVPPAEGAAKGKALARKALEIDETGEAHAALGWAILLYDYDYAEAEKEFQQAIALYPDYAFAHMWYGLCLCCVDRLEEALAHGRRGLQLDHLSPIVNMCYAFVIWILRDWDRCIYQCRRALDINPDFLTLRWMLANALQAKSCHEEAIRERQRVVDASGSTLFLAELGSSYAAAGKRTEALRILDQLHELRGHKYVMAHSIALIHAGLGERDDGFRWLDAALEERSASLAYVNVDPRLDCLRPDPRFQKLLDRMQQAHR